MKDKLSDDLDALFQLPLADFTGARNALATRLKKEGRTADADRVKTLTKPAISVWTVNQLYWRHRDQFEQLLAAGQSFRRAHTSRSGKPAELSAALEARRAALNELSNRAEKLLAGAGHNPGLDTLRRIATTLEAMSAYAALPEDQAAGRLTKDLDPPGFESLAPFIRAVPTTRQNNEPARLRVVEKSAITGVKTTTATKSKDTPRGEELKQARLAAARTTLQSARKSLMVARTKAQAIGKDQKKADAAMKLAEKQKREAELRFKEASTASTEAAIRAQNTTRELERASKAVADAERAIEAASKELDTLMRDKK